MSTTLPPALAHELWQLIEAACENRLSPAEHARLEELVLQQPAARQAYVSYMSLHGLLYWDLACGLGAQSAENTAATDNLVPHGLERDLQTWAAAQPEPAPRRRWSRTQQRWGAGLVSAIAACLIISVSLTSPPVAPVLPATQAVVQNANITGEAPQPIAQAAGTGQNKRVFQPINVAQIPAAVPATDHPDSTASQTLVAAGPGTTPPVATPGTTGDGSVPVLVGVTGSQRQVVGFINDQLRAKWQAAGIQPSAVADDAEWLRRVYLDLVGYVPPVSEVDRFLADKSRDKRAALVDRLLDDPSYARHMASLWGNLLIGRSPREEVNRPALLAFLRHSFSGNRPWSDIVYDLVSAEGRADQNGAVNFLVAHLNDGAIPATAVTSRLFLGLQMQCVQCHNHPFNTWKQEQFWAFNSFFQQAVIVREERRDPVSGQMVIASVTLQTKEIGGPVYFETRSGLMKVAYPTFKGQSVDADEKTNRRAELAKLMTHGETTGLAPAFVNRVWEHFLGRSFTPRVDDMGPHNAPSHPELLDRLSEEFVRSGYDVKQLMRWVCLSDAYQRTSRFGDQNAVDDPEKGEVPLFSRVYVKPLTAEQLFDSLQVATRGTWVPDSDLVATERRQQQWMQQFVMSFETEENDEASTFNGSITQSLLMMNGDLVSDAVKMEPGTWLYQLISSRKTDTERIQALFKAALSRPATPRELAQAKKLLQSAAQHQTSPVTAYQDLYWAFLNSNEFILNH